jgi:hypothetical protein
LASLRFCASAPLRFIILMPVTRAARRVSSRADQRVQNENSCAFVAASVSFAR